MKNKFLYLPLTIIIALLPFSTWSALSATTASTIRGIEPLLTADGGIVPSNLNHAISFTVNGSRYFGNSAIPSPLTVPSTLGFSKTLTFNDFNANFDNTQFYSPDGDGPAAIPITYTTLTTKWTDKYGQTISPTSTDNLDSCFAPYQLDIAATNVQVHSQYGDPTSSTAANLNHTFYIYVDDYQRICGILPTNMDWYLPAPQINTPPTPTQGSWNKQSGRSGTNNIDTTYGGGYDISQFDPLLGFKPSLAPAFPTTAFPQASFSIVVPEPQTDYIITDLTSTSGLKSLVQTTTNGLHKTNDNKIIFSDVAGSKPANTIKINIKHQPSLWNTDYSFSVTLWGRAYGPALVNYCDNNGYSNFSRQQLSNSPQNSALPMSAVEHQFNAFTRKIGSFNGEWGNMSYANSGLGWGYYWTSETYNTANQWAVNLANGSIYPASTVAPTNLFNTFCKE